jgi:hypothetical protein
MSFERREKVFLVPDPRYIILEVPIIGSGWAYLLLPVGQFLIDLIGPRLTPGNDRNSRVVLVDAVRVEVRGRYTGDLDRLLVDAGCVMKHCECNDKHAFLHRRKRSRNPFICLGWDNKRVDVGFRQGHKVGVSSYSSMNTSAIKIAGLIVLRTSNTNVVNQHVSEFLLLGAPGVGWHRRNTKSLCVEQNATVNLVT